jgi:Domain of unknown function (DUF6285)
MLDRPSATAILAALDDAQKAGIPAGIQQAIAVNAAALAAREIESAEALHAGELARLTVLLGQEAPLAELNAALAQGIRGGGIGSDRAEVRRHLIRTTLAKLTVDQPNYPAFMILRSPAD